MPNYCYFNMFVVARDAETIGELVDTMTDYDRPRHMFRVFDAYASDAERREDGLYEATVEGCCAWSVASCMCEGRGTYYDADPEHGITLRQASAVLNPAVEVTSTEVGMGFAEHYAYCAGEEFADETVDYAEYDFDPEVDGDEAAFREEHAVPSDAVYDEGLGCLIVGGFAERFPDMALMVPHLAARRTA